MTVSRKGKREMNVAPTSNVRAIESLGKQQGVRIGDSR
jgi:hypothetical protein